MLYSDEQRKRVNGEKVGPRNTICSENLSERVRATTHRLCVTIIIIGSHILSYTLYHGHTRKWLMGEMGRESDIQKWPQIWHEVDWLQGMGSKENKEYCPTVVKIVTET